MSACRIICHVLWSFPNSACELLRTESCLTLLDSNVGENVKLSAVRKIPKTCRQTNYRPEDTKPAKHHKCSCSYGPINPFSTDKSTRLYTFHFSLTV